MAVTGYFHDKEDRIFGDISNQLFNLSSVTCPCKAIDDAGHVAIAATHRIDYLLTWNCRHLDNAEIKPLIRAVCSKHGYICPEICTPEELMGVGSYEG